MELESGHERNKEHCREDRERLSPDGEKKRPSDFRMDVQQSPFPLCDQTAIFRQAYRLDGDRSAVHPLDIDYVCELLCFSRHLSDSIGAAAVPRRSQRDLRTPIKRRGGDAHIVRGDDHQIQAFSAQTAFPYMSQKGLSSNGMQWFTWKSRGIPPGGNNSNRFAHARGWDDGAIITVGSK